jgi:hypothetical protein
VSKEIVGLLLLALAGILVGGAYTLWKTARKVATVVGLASLLAIGAAVAWLVG